MRRVVTYVDGFNLYHAIDDLGRPHLKWLNLHALAADLCGSNETPVGVNYFTAHATWRPTTVGRHIEYVKALKSVGVYCIIGHFKEKRRRCKHCGKETITHEEKESDVALAVKLVADGMTDQYDRALIISADSDLGPAIRTVKKHYPSKTINVIAPPGRFSHARDLKPLFALTPGRIARCLLPREAFGADGKLTYSRPAAYDPPS